MSERYTDNIFDGILGAALDSCAPGPSPADDGDPHRKSRVRAKTISIKRLSKREIERGKLLYPDVQSFHPRTRGDCSPLHSPCPWCTATVVMKVVFNAEEFSTDRSDRTQVRVADGAVQGGVNPKRQRDDSDVEDAVRLRGDSRRDGREPEVRKGAKLRVLQAEARDVRDARVQRVGFDDRTMHESSNEELPVVRRSRDRGLRAVEGGLQGLHRGHGSKAIPQTQSRSDQQRRPVQSGELSMGDADAAGSEQAHVACPECGRRVRYRRGVGGEGGHWERYAEGETAEGMDARESSVDARVLCRCRPCIRVSCKHHLYLDVNERTGSIKMNFPDLEVWELPDTCTLDIADRGGITLEEVGELLNLTRERIRQLETRALAKLRGLSAMVSADDYLEDTSVEAWGAK